MSLNSDQIREIAKKALDDFESLKFPTAKEIAWAFPICYSSHTAKFMDGSILNGQQCNAHRALTLFDAYGKTLDYSKKGKFVLHIMHGDPIFDASHLHWPYLARVNNELRESNYPEPIRSIEQRLRESTYWERMPEDLAKSVVRTDSLMHGSNGKPSENMTSLSDYLDAIKQTLRISRDYVNELVSNGRQKEPVLVRADPTDFKEGDYLQIAFYRKEGAIIDQGFSRGISNGLLGVDIWTPVYGKEIVTLDESLSTYDWDIEKLKEAKPTMWRLEYPK
ncbi:MAG: hypothetical protein Q8P81_04510 [Nanoarchaeota archaeon]|nr:hypothetical protein [Nanoarchaeota archaeon]